MRRVLRPLLLAMSLAALSAQVAFAGGPIHEKYRVDETYQAEVCGLTVTERVQINGNVLIFDDHVVDLSRVRVTWTNEDGDWLQLDVAGPVTVIDEWNGDILTQTAHHRGVHHRLRSAEGIFPATFDRGQIVFKTVVDFSDPEEPMLVSQDILFEAGPHPLAHSATDVFCEAMLEALGQ